MTKEQFVQLAKKHLFVLEDIEINKNTGCYDMNIYGIEKLYEEIYDRKRNE